VKAGVPARRQLTTSARPKVAESSSQSALGPHSRRSPAPSHRPPTHSASHSRGQLLRWRARQEPGAPYGSRGRRP